MRQAAATMMRTVVALCGCRPLLSIVPVCFCVSATACFAVLLNSNQAWSCMCIGVPLKARIALSVAVITIGTLVACKQNLQVDVRFLWDELAATDCLLVS